MKLHRMMPLLMTISVVYQFCGIIIRETGEVKVGEMINNLLLLQAVYVLLFYVMDFLRMKCSLILEIVLSVSLFFMDIGILLGYNDTSWYRSLFLVYIILCMLTVLIIVTFAYIKYAFSIKEYLTATYLYVAALLPVVVMIIKYIIKVDVKIPMSIALTCSCLILYRLMIKGTLEDTIDLLQEKMYLSSKIPTILYDEDMFYIDANKAARKLFAEEIESFESKRLSLNCTEVLTEILEEHGGQKELYFGDTGQGEKYVRLVVEPEYYKGELRGYISYAMDITKQKAETIRMEELKEEAEHKTNQKSSFLARMSHDLRSPLHAIIGISEILGKKKEVSEKNRALIMHIHHEGKNLLEQVNAILEFSKLESGKYELEMKKYDIEKLLEDVAFSSVVNLKSKPVHFSASIVTKHPRELIGDEMRVREIMQNILSNAVKYTKIGEIRCELSIEYKSDSDVFVTFTVSDTGSGMSREDLEEMFDEYSTFNDKKKEGTGLGLPIVKQLTELMGGGVYVSSEKKTGTSITACFNQKVEKEAEVFPVVYSRELFARRAQVAMENVSTKWIYPKARVLVADDVKVNHIVFGEMAVPWQFQIDYVRNGKEAIEAVSKNHYQMIFLDQMMPEMTGLEAAEYIKRRSLAKMILVTADISDNARTEFAKYGFSDYLSKPIDMYRFKKIIEEYMPKEFREEAQMTPLDKSKSNIKSYRRMLETFVAEVEPLCEKLESSVYDDIEFYRIKIHGIRGVSRQIGFLELSEQAEILEMAAKTENISFIERRHKDFMKDMQEALHEIKKELRFLPKLEENPEVMPKPMEEIIRELKKGFEEYDIESIEKNIEILKKSKYSKELEELVEKAEKCARELEYEDGVKAVELIEKKIEK